jgi:hypothetical protein
MNSRLGFIGAFLCLSPESHNVAKEFSRTYTHLIFGLGALSNEHPENQPYPFVLHANPGSILLWSMRQVNETSAKTAPMREDQVR